jgi:hypothetical protein
MIDTFKCACPECGQQVTCRHAPSNTGIGTIPYVIQIRIGPEHDSKCKYWSPVDGVTHP